MRNKTKSGGEASHVKHATREFEEPLESPIIIDPPPTSFPICSSNTETKTPAPIRKGFQRVLLDLE